MKHALSSLRDYNIFVDNLKDDDVIFDKFDVAEDTLFNQILLLGKFYIYSRNARMVCLLFRISLPGQGVFITSNSILPGRETN